MMWQVKDLFVFVVGRDESGLSGAKGAKMVHNDAIWSSHGAMHTHSIRSASFLSELARADVDVCMVNSVCVFVCVEQIQKPY